MWSHLGTIHCLSGKGRCWDLRGIMPKKGFLTVSVILQKVYQNAKNQRFWRSQTNSDFPWVTLLYCVPKINFTFYVLNEMQKTFQIDNLLFLSLSVFFWRGEGLISNIISYKGGGSTRQNSWWRESHHRELPMKYHQPPLPHKKWTVP